MRTIVPGIIDLPKFNYEDLEEIVAGGQGSFWSLLLTQVVTYIRTTPTSLQRFYCLFHTNF